ncbi:hypothetical protein LC040_15545 [Bacillus tianshenii]|nr:hypothetical protein LC040_15545 [Bacillus tianshenii]
MKRLFLMCLGILFFLLTSTSTYAESINLVPYTILDKHESNVSAIAYSPDGDLVVSGTEDGEMIIWYAKSGAVIEQIPAHSDEVTDILFTYNGKTIITASSDQTIKMWDTTSGSELITLEGHTGTIAALTIVDNGDTLVSGDSNGGLFFWDIGTGIELSSVTMPGGVTDIAYLEDDEILAIALDNNNLQLRNAENGSYIRNIQNIVAQSNSRGLNQIVFTADDKQLFGSSDSLISQPIVLDVTNDYENMTLEPEQFFNGYTDRDGWKNLIISANRKYIASLGSSAFSHSENVFYIYDSYTGELVTSLSVNDLENSIEAIAFHPELDGFAATDGSVIRLYDTNKLKERKSLRKLEYSPIHTVMDIDSIQTITATATYDDGSTEMIPADEIVWSTTNFSVAIGNEDTIIARGEGKATLTAKYKIFKETFTLEIKDFKFTPPTTYTTFETEVDMPVKANKEWKIEFNTELDGNTVNEETVGVIAKDGTIIEVDVVLNEDNKTISVTPASNYASGEYYLYVKKEIMSRNEVQMKESLRMWFEVE